MTKAQRTRQYILETTAPLFNTKGFDGTSLADLTASTGLTKGALYGNFKDKHEIAREAFRFAIGRTREMANREMARAHSYKQRLVALLDFYKRHVFDPPVAGGCPMLNAAIEADDHRVEMRPVVAEALMNTVSFIAELLQKGVAHGEFKRDIDPQALAYTFFCAVEGALMFARVERSLAPMEAVVGHCKNLLNQISTTNATT